MVPRRSKQCCRSSGRSATGAGSDGPAATDASRTGAQAGDQVERNREAGSGTESAKPRETQRMSLDCSGWAPSGRGGVNRGDNSARKREQLSVSQAA
jgi:hypothetical protein